MRMMASSSDVLWVANDIFCWQVSVGRMEEPGERGGAWPEAIIDLTLRLCIPFVQPEMWNPGFYGQPGFAARFQAVLSVRWVGMHSWVPGCDHGSQGLI